MRTTWHALSVPAIGVLAWAAARCPPGVAGEGPLAAVPKALSPELKDSEKQYRESLAQLCQSLSKSPAAAPVPVDLGGWPALQIPACAVAGLVLLGEGHTLTSGALSTQLNKLYKYALLATQACLAQYGDKDSWTLGFGILFLSEVHRVNPSLELRAHIAALAKRLEAGLEGEKGWRHGLQPEKGEHYGPFIGVSIWCTAALAAAKEQGVAVDETKLRTALACLRKCVGKFGGAQYFSYQPTTVGPGRSAAILWVLRRYTAEPGPEAERAQGFFLRNVASAHEGHGSQVMNLGWSALGAAVSGPEASAAFWKAHFKTLQGARQADGSFPHQDWRDVDFPDAGGKGTPRVRTDNTTWPDKMYGQAWTQVWMLLAWQCGLGKCVLAAKLPPPPAPAAESAAKKEKDAALQAAVAEASDLLKTGKAGEAAKKLDAALREHSGHAELLVLRALACVPALAQPLGALDPKSCADGKDGWGSANESQALSYLERALRAREGKGLVAEAFDAGVQLLMARVHGKRLVRSVQAHPRSPEWVPLYQTFAKSIESPVQNVATQAEAVRCLQAVMAYLPKKTSPSPSAGGGH